MNKTKKRKPVFQWKSGLTFGEPLLEKQNEWTTFQCGFNITQKCFLTLSIDQVCIGKM